MTIRTAIVIILVASSGYFFGAQPSYAAFVAESIAQRSKSTDARAVQRNVRFSGAVRKGRSFERQIGANLFFRLVPEELGWAISVGSKAVRGNFCSVVTPPYRGMNALRIEGWHFRNSDNSGPNEPGPNNVNAPQEHESFTLYSMRRITGAPSMRCKFFCGRIAIQSSTSMRRKALTPRYARAEAS